MSLDRAKLQMVRELGNGGWQARCPACAESGQDRKGEHLRVAVDGKFGCCVFAGDREHRKRIFALAGSLRTATNGPKAIKVKVAATKTASGVQLDLSAFAKAAAEGLGRLGRAVGSAECEVQSAECETEGAAVNVGTLGTGVSDPRACANETDLYMGELIGSQEGVPSVPVDSGNRADGTGGTNGRNGERVMVRLPYLLADGTLVIPFSAPVRYHWWNGGQRVRQTLAELLERKQLDASPF